MKAHRWVLVVFAVLLSATSAFADLPLNVVDDVKVLCAVKDAKGASPFPQLQCPQWEQPSVAALGRANAPLIAFKPTLQFDPCDAIAQVIDWEQTEKTKELDGYFRRALGDLQMSCGLPTRSTRSLIQQFCAEADQTLGSELKTLEAKAPAKRTSEDQTRLTTLDAFLRHDCADAKTAAGYYGPMITVASAAGHPKGSATCGISTTASGGAPLAIQRRCGLAKESAGALDVLVPAVEGLGDFLKARAKDELVDFAMSTLGKDLCSSALGKEWFVNTCGEMFPKGTDSAPNLEVITNGDIAKYIALDLEALPAKLLEKLPLGGVTNEKELRGILIATATHLVALQHNPQEPLAFLKDLEVELSKSLKGRLICSFVDPKSPPSAACGSLLLLSFAATAGVELPQSETGARNIEAASEWAKAATEHFCATYNNLKDGACVIGPSAPEVWDAIAAWIAAFQEFHDRIVGAIEKLKSDRNQGASLAVLADDGAVIGDIFATVARKWVEGTLKLDKNPADQAKLKDIAAAFELPPLALRAASAALGKDYPQVAANVRAILTAPIMSEIISDDFKKASVFFIDLSTAKDRDAARKMIEDVASPLGTYKEKYKGTKWLMLNGYVGVFGGYRFRFATQTGLPDGEGNNAQFVPLSAPFGIDATFAHSKYVHFGASLIAIDPLAIDPSNKKGQVLEGVLTPGAFIRLGIGGWPLVLVVGVRGQPLLESSDNICGADGKTACWKGQFSVLGGVAVDVPVFAFH